MNNKPQIITLIFAVLMSSSAVSLAEGDIKPLPPTKQCKYCKEKPTSPMGGWSTSGGSDESTQNGNGSANGSSNDGSTQTENGE